MLVVYESGIMVNDVCGVNYPFCQFSTSYTRNYKRHVFHENVNKDTHGLCRFKVKNNEFVVSIIRALKKEISI